MQMIDPFPDDQRVREVTMALLNRRTGAVLELVDRGERVIVTRHGRPLAVIVPIDRALELFVGGERFIKSRLEPALDEVPKLDEEGDLDEDGSIRG